MPVLVFSQAYIQPVNDLGAGIAHFMQRIIDVFLSKEFVKPVERFIITDQ